MNEVTICDLCCGVKSVKHLGDDGDKCNVEITFCNGNTATMTTTHADFEAGCKHCNCDKDGVCHDEA